MHQNADCDGCADGIGDSVHVYITHNCISYIRQSTGHGVIRSFHHLLDVYISVQASSRTGFLYNHSILVVSGEREIFHSAIITIYIFALTHEQATFLNI